MNTMRTVGYRETRTLIDAELPVPTPGPHDLLVRVEAVSMNPADTKVLAATDPGDELKVLGYDAAGVVNAVGSAVTLFAPGDEVYYAGSVDRQGTNAEFHLVHENIVGHKPASLDFAAAAALPLTAITAWETLFDRFGLTKDSTGTLLVLAAAGGVGSMLVQLAAKLTDLTVIGSASRQESQEWVRSLGADHIVDHHGDLAAQLKDLGGVDYLFTAHSAGNIETFAEILRPGGHITAIDEPEGLDLLPLKSKSISWHWELMFTRPLFTPDDPAQHELLDEVARLVDAGTLVTTMTTQLRPINAEQLSEAHRLVESGSTIGKIVITN